MRHASQTPPQTRRLHFSKFSEADAPAFAKLLSDPEVTRSIMAKATTPEQCLTCAFQRIEWHNSSWNSHGYGVWALRERQPDGTSAGPIIGWSGLTATIHGPTPEILYGLARRFWGIGLASEAARATIDWAFRHHLCDAIDAVVFGPLNPGSAGVARKLGMKRIGAMPFATFLPDMHLGRDVLDYEIWRLREGACQSFEALLFQAPFKAGLLVSAGVASPEATLADLQQSARQHPDRGDISETEIDRTVLDAFNRGLNENDTDHFRITHSDWSSLTSCG